MRLNLMITCMAYLYLGFAAAFQQFGLKAGFSVEIVITVWVSALLLFLYAVFVPMQKIKDVLFKKPEPPSSETTAL